MYRREAGSCSKPSPEEGRADTTFMPSPFQGARDSFEPFGLPERGVRDTPWIGVNFECAGAYVRVYRNPSGTAYLARCPRCSAAVRFRVGAGGTDERFFKVRC